MNCQFIAGSSEFSEFLIALKCGVTLCEVCGLFVWGDENKNEISPYSRAV
jgi:hypothetical protein